MSRSCMTPQPSNMLIATLDLLGVTHMISNADGASGLMVVYNSIVSVYGDIKNKSAQILNQVPSEISKHGIGRDIATNFCTSMADAIQTNFFSDTIVIGLNLDICSTGDAKFSTATRRVAISFFFCYVKLIAYSLMAKGFPVRGSVDSGIVLCGRDLVVGVPYVNTLRNSEQIECSGVVVTESAFNLYNDGSEKLNRLCPLIKLSIPVKGKYIEAICMNWLRRTEVEPSDIMDLKIGDIEQILYEKFSAHGKIMGESAIIKLKNTAMTIRAFLAQNKKLS